MVDDDPVQSPMARALLSAPFALSASVLLEAEWVLRSGYHWDRQRIARSLMEIVDLPMLVSGPPGAGWALDRYAAGADFADMIHLASAPPADRFVTFDRRIVRKAGPKPPLPIETLR